MIMDKYQAAIVEYEAARKQIIQLGSEISKSMIDWDKVEFAPSCICSQHNFDCVGALYKWNLANREYERYINRTHYYEEDQEPDAPDGEEPPELCEAGKITDKLIQDRKAAKKRFGIAKRRLSALAKSLANQNS
jgi:hypothetical protein